MNTVSIFQRKYIFKKLFVFIIFYFLCVPFSWAATASLSANTINISAGENGSFTITGNDDGNEYDFRWSLPDGLNITTGASSNLSRFRVRTDRGYIQVKSDGRGSFFATINVSSNNNGSFILSNLRAEITLNPADVSVNVGTTATSTTESTTPATSGSGTADYTFYVDNGQVDITASPDSGNGATSLPVWGYTDINGGSGRVPGPVINAVEGGTITVEVVNNHNRDHNFVVQGITSDTTAIPPGGSRIYTLSTPSSGVYFYRDTLANNVNRSLGLLGAVVVRPSTGSTRAWSGGPSFDYERLWVINDMDVPRWNNVAIDGGNVNTANYRPNYFLMNGMNGFQAMGDAATSIEGTVSETFIVRIVNGGQYDQSLHFHSNHFRVISRNGNRLSSFEYQDTINVKAGSTAMLLYQLNQPGHYPMHVHTAQMETGNGVYLNGTAAMIIAH